MKWRGKESVNDSVETAKTGTAATVVVYTSLRKQKKVKKRSSYGGHLLPPCKGGGGGGEVGGRKGGEKKETCNKKWVEKKKGVNQKEPHTGPKTKKGGGVPRKGYSIPGGQKTKMEKTSQRVGSSPRRHNWGGECTPTKKKSCKGSSSLITRKAVLCRREKDGGVHQSKPGEERKERPSF